MRHFLSLWDLEGDQLNELLDEAIRLKEAHQRGERPPLLAGHVLGLVFEKPSLRTRASFEAAVAQLGGTSLFLSNCDGAMGVRETVPDFARTLSQYADELVQNGDPAHAVDRADVIYTDVWTSMGQEAEREQRLAHFEGYQVNGALLARAPAHTRVMHCLPAHRGEEVTDEVLDGSRSIAF